MGLRLKRNGQRYYDVPRHPLAAHLGVYDEALSPTTGPRLLLGWARLGFLLQSTTSTRLNFTRSYGKIEGAGLKNWINSLPGTQPGGSESAMVTHFLVDSAVPATGLSHFVQKSTRLAIWVCRSDVCVNRADLDKAFTSRRAKNIASALIMCQLGFVLKIPRA
eukprot:SAG11_NODE_4277_length_1971_cov_1.058226_3_plen_163_part_00